jgi:hypothetical protein
MCLSSEEGAILTAQTGTLARGIGVFDGEPCGSPAPKGGIASYVPLYDLRQIAVRYLTFLGLMIRGFGRLSERSLFETADYIETGASGQ